MVALLLLRGSLGSRGGVTCNKVDMTMAPCEGENSSWEGTSPRAALQPDHRRPREASLLLVIAVLVLP